MKLYDVVAAAFALQADAKWVDNVLSHHAILGVERARRGRSRRLKRESILHLLLVRELGVTVGIPVARAAIIARELLAAETFVARDIRVAADLTSLAALLDRRLGEAAEGAIPPRRGRPPARRG